MEVGLLPLMLFGFCALMVLLAVCAEYPLIRLWIGGNNAGSLVVALILVIVLIWRALADL